MPHELEAAGITVTAGELIAHLAQFPPDTPVTALKPDAEWWLNIWGASNPGDSDEPSIILFTKDNFDTRQF